MAAFRKRLTALAVLVLALGLITTAGAQTAAFQCTANAGVPPLLRSEGLTELTGDIVLNCVGGTPSLSTTVPGGTVANLIPTANISVFLNTPITSRLVNSSNLSEVLLLIDEPAFADQRLCTTSPTCPIQGTSTVSGVPGSNPFKTGTNPNIWQGVVSGNAVTFTGVPVEPPGSVGTRVYRITNLRSNANAAGGSVSVPGGFSTPNQVVALISATPATSSTLGTSSSFPINNPQQIVGFVQRSLEFSVRDPVSGNVTTSGIALPQCRDVAPKDNFFTLRFGELFATAFKTRTVATPAAVTESTSPAPAQQNVPGLIYNSESGFYSSAVTGTTGNALVGLADFGTRLRASFNNIPAGVNLFVSVFNQNRATGRVARLVGSAEGTFFPVAATNTDFTNATDSQVASITLTTGSGAAVWEVLQADPLVVQNYDFRVFYGFTSNVGNNVPAIGTGLVAGSYAPISSVTTASQTAPIPRFVDTGVGSPFFRTAVCRTLLLFPFVTNQSGFDTGLAIANTTTDPFGTAAQNGSCDLFFYGANAPSVINTGSIASGTVYATVSSTVAPNFQGYVFAVCSFQLGHGFAFVSDIGARNLAMGYLALVVPDPRASSALTGLPLNPGQAGELLGQ